MLTFNPTKTKNTYKILYVGNFATHSVGEPEIARALKSMGHEVTTLGLGFVSPGILEGMASRFDFVLMSKVHDSAVTDGFLGKIPTVCWQFDLYWGYRPSHLIKSEPHFKADVVFTSDGGHQKEFEEAGIKHFVLRQGIEAGVKPGKAGNMIDVGFVGTAGGHTKWPYREELLNWLEATYGDRFKRFGYNGRLRHKELDDTIASMKIVMCDSVYSPNYWSNRIYEMVGRGGFVIHPKVEGLEKEFEYYKHIVPYNYGDFKGLKEKIDYFLAHDKEREKIRKAGYDHCHKHHTYTHRAKKLIETLEGEKII